MSVGGAARFVSSDKSAGAPRRSTGLRDAVLNSAEAAFHDFSPRCRSRSAIEGGHLLNNPATVTDSYASGLAEHRELATRTLARRDYTGATQCFVSDSSDTLVG